MTNRPRATGKVLKNSASVNVSVYHREPPTTTNTPNNAISLTVNRDDVM